MKRLFALFSVFCVFFALFLITSCSNSKDAENKQVTDSLAPVAEEINDGITDYSLYEAPEVKDFEGYEFRILETPDSNVFSFHKQVPEEEVGEIVNDAFIKRNLTISEKYNIKISSIYNNDPNSVLKREIAAGGDICDIGFVHSSEVFGIAQTGGLIDFNAVNTLNLDMPWWDQRIIESLSIYNKIYTLTGDITTNDDVSTFTILYNKKLYGDLGYDNPYEIVTKGLWTMDKMGEMIKGVSRDLDGDGIINENDQWGAASESAAMYFFFFGSGMHYIKKTSDVYEFTLDDIKTQSILEKTFNLLTSEDCVYDLDGTIKDKSVSVYETLEKMFIEDRLLFNVRLVGDALHLRDMESSFGFLPFPKYDEIQEEYYSWVTWNTYSIVMPVTVIDTEKSGLIMEALAYESMYTIREPFYGNLLDVKIARADEDTQMLELILNSKAYDLDGVNSFTGIQSGLYNIMNAILVKREFNIASSWAAMNEKAVGQLDKFLQSFK